MNVRFSTVLLAALFSLAWINTASATYSPRQGRFLQADPIGYKGGMNLYEYVRSNPVNNVDYLGTEPTTSQPNTQPSTQPTTQPGQGENFIDPNNPSLGIYKSSSPGGPNCLGYACKKDKFMSWNYDKGYVPKGCREVSCSQVSTTSSPCNNCERELIVSTVENQNPPHEKGFHVIFRDVSKLPVSWSGRLGDGTGMPDSLAGSGAYVHDITDYKGHFNWYWKELENPGENLKEEIRCFCCKTDQM